MKWMRDTLGQAHQVVHGEHTLALDHAVDHQAVLRGVNVPPALVVSLKVQTAGGDDAEQALQGCEADRRLWHPGQAGAFAALQRSFPLAGKAIGIHGHRQT
jgi:hypothetical protein